MTLDRREMLRGLGGFTGGAVLGTFRAHALDAPQASGFPRKSDFLIDDGYTYLNAAYTHPIPRVAIEAVRRAAEGRASMPPPTSGQSGTPRTLFAELVNAKPSEIAYVSRCLVRAIRRLCFALLGRTISALLS